MFKKINLVLCSLAFVGLTAVLHADSQSDAIQEQKRLDEQNVQKQLDEKRLEQERIDQDNVDKQLEQRRLDQKRQDRKLDDARWRRSHGG